ncbi:MAG: CoA transferase [Chloroflexi bacterium]|nr:CoA transferase [Chloroflexota bacterium]MDA1002603.1 CoA transferase [Chloroflexota bacterium]
MASGPLNGVKVLEFTQIIAGPMSCQMLSDLGADVIKVEPPGGEPWRLQGQFIPLESKVFQALNRGKRSLAIDVSHAQAQEAIHRLVRETDVVVINYRPDVAKRLRVDYETLRPLKPDLIYVDNTAFGRAGPWANRPGYDIVVQAASGLMSSVGKVDEKGTPVVPPAFADFTTAYSITIGTCAALYHRALTGQGQKVETSLLINALNLQQNQVMSLPAADAAQQAAFMSALTSARETGTSYADFLKQRDGILRAGAAGNIYYRSYLTKDGAVAIGALSASLRAKVRAVLAVEHNRDDPGYDAADAEQQRIDLALTARVEAMLSAESTAYWEERFERGGVPVSPVYFAQELETHPQVLANAYLVELEHDLTGPQTMLAPPWKMSETPPAAQSAAPPLGRDTDAILGGVGYSADEISALRANGIIR